MGGADVRACADEILADTDDVAALVLVLEGERVAEGVAHFAFALLSGDVEEMCERAVAEKSLMILPDKVFDVRENRFRFGMGRKNFPKALEVFGEFLQNWSS